MKIATQFLDGNLLTTLIIEEKIHIMKFRLCSGNQFPAINPLLPETAN